MPPIIIGLAIALSVGPAIGAGIITSIALGNALIGLGLSMAVSGLAQILTKHPSATSGAAQISHDLGSSTVSIRQAVAPRITQYGQDRRGGVFTFLHLSGTNNEFLNMVITLTGHQVESINNMYFDGVLVPLDGSGNATGRFAGFVHVEKKTGAPGEAAFAGLIAAAPTKWTVNHRQDGCASVYVQLKWSADVFPGSIPAIKFDVKGKQVFDPRTGLTAYSENVALCVRDYLTATKANANALTAALGLGEGPANVDTTTTIASANTCDELLLKKDLTTESRYTCNGSFSADMLPSDIIPMLLSAMAGTPVYSEGVWKIYAAAYRLTPLTLGDRDLRDSIKYQPLLSRRDLANSVKGTYKSPFTAWQPDDFPQVINAAAVTADGESIWLDMQLPFTTSPSMAQRIAKIQLLRIRNQGTCTFPGQLSAYQAEVADVIQVTRPRFGWTAKAFEVSNAQLKIVQDANNNPIIGCDLSLRETDPSVYAWNATLEETTIAAAPPVTNLPDPTSVAPCSTISAVLDALGSTAAQAAQVLRVTVSFTPPADQYVLDGGHIWIEQRDHADMVWRFEGKVAGAETQFFCYNVLTGHTYDFRVKAEGSMGGVFSSTIEQDNVAVTGTQILLMSAAHANQGSMRPSAMPAFTIATNSNNGAGACTVRITASATSLPLTDGSSLSMPAVDTTWGGVLAASTTYLFVPRLKLADLSVHFATGTSANADADQPTVPLTSGATQTQKNQLSVNQYFDGYVPLSDGYIQVTTPNNAGTGGGSSGGDPSCVHEDTPVCVAGVIIPAKDAEVGDMIKGENTLTGAKVFRRIRAKRREYCSDWYKVEGRLVTPCEPFWHEGGWVPAFEMPGALQVTNLPGYKVSLSIDAEEFDNCNFVIINPDGGEQTVHNPVLPRS